MPPWSADTLFQRYTDERILTAEEKSTLLTWIAEGGKEGGPGLAPAPPIYQENIISAKLDLVV